MSGKLQHMKDALPGCRVTQHQSTYTGKVRFKLRCRTCPPHRPDRTVVMDNLPLAMNWWHDHQRTDQHQLWLRTSAADGSALYGVEP